MASLHKRIKNKGQIFTWVGLLVPYLFCALYSPAEGMLYRYDRPTVTHYITRDN